MGGLVPTLAVSNVTRRAKLTSLHAVESFMRGGEIIHTGSSID